MSHSPDDIQTTALLAMAIGGESAIDLQERRGQSALTREFDTLPVQGLGYNRAALEALGFQIGERVDDLFVSVVPPEGWRLRRTSHPIHNDILDADGNVRGSLMYKAAIYDRDASFHLARRYYVDAEYDCGTPPVYEKRKRDAWVDDSGREVAKPDGRMALSPNGDIIFIDKDGNSDRDAFNPYGRSRNRIRRTTKTEDVLVTPGTPYDDQTHRHLVRDRMNPDAEPLFATEWKRNGDRDAPSGHEECAAWLAANLPEHDDVLAYWQDEPVSTPSP